MNKLISITITRLWIITVCYKFIQLNNTGSDKGKVLTSVWSLVYLKEFVIIRVFVFPINMCPFSVNKLYFWLYLRSTFFIFFSFIKSIMFRVWVYIQIIDGKQL